MASRSLAQVLMLLEPGLEGGRSPTKEEHRGADIWFHAADEAGAQKT